MLALSVALETQSTTGGIVTGGGVAARALLSTREGGERGKGGRRGRRGFREGEERRKEGKGDDFQLQDILV